MDRLRIFISSRISGNESWRDAIREQCEEVGHEAILYPERSQGSWRHKEYMNQLGESNVVVYLLSEPTTDAVQREIDVVVKIGKPLLVLVHKPTTAMRDDNLVLSDAGREFGAKFSIQVKYFGTHLELRALVKNEIEGIVARRFSEPRQLVPWGGDAYSRAVKSIRSVAVRFALLQETSSFLLGPKKGRTAAEKEFLEEFYVLAEEVQRDEDARVLMHLYDGEATLDAFQRERELYPEAERWLRRAADLASKDSASLMIIGVQGPISPLMIWDDSLMTCHFFGGEGKFASVHREVGEWSLNAWNSARAAAKGMTLRDVFDQLGYEV